MTGAYLEVLSYSDLTLLLLLLLIVGFSISVGMALQRKIEEKNQEERCGCSERSVDSLGSGTTRLRERVSTVPSLPTKTSTVRFIYPSDNGGMGPTTSSMNWGQASGQGRYDAQPIQELTSVLKKKPSRVTKAKSKSISRTSRRTKIKKPR
jgi:hypothetical protein